MAGKRCRRANDEQYGKTANLLPCPFQQYQIKIWHPQQTNLTLKRGNLIAATVHRKYQINPPWITIFD